MRTISNDGACHRRPKPIVDTVTPTSIHRGVFGIKMLMSHHGKVSIVALYKSSSPQLYNTTDATH
jgi:hypothetical protein